MTPEQLAATVQAFMERDYDDPAVLLAGWSDDMIFVLAMARQYAERKAAAA